MAETWPWQIPIAATFRPSSSSATGGRSLNGSEFLVKTDSGYWRAAANISVRNEDASLAYRSMLAALNGAAGHVLVPAYSRWRPRDYNNRMPSAAVANGINGQPLLDHGGVGFVETPTMWTAGAAVRRSTRLLIKHPHIDSIRPGHYFGLGERLYIVSRQWGVSSEVPVPNGILTYGEHEILFGIDQIAYGEEGVTITGENTSMIDIWPPLREAVAADEPLILGSPVCKMRLASDDSGTLDMGWSRTSQIPVEFEEVI